MTQHVPKPQLGSIHRPRVSFTVFPRAAEAELRCECAAKRSVGSEVGGARVVSDLQMAKFFLKIIL